MASLAWPFFALLSATGGRVAWAEGAPVIRSISDFWTVPEDQKKSPQPVRIEFVVYYYDPAWRLLWGGNEGWAGFLPTGTHELRVAPGQRVRLEGTVVPSVGFDGSTLKVTVLAEKAMPTPLPTHGALDDMGSLDAQWVTIEGYVCRQAEVDPRHLSLDVLAEGRLVNAHILLGDSEPVPILTNGHVRLNCVYVSNREPSGRLHRIDAWSPRRSDVTVLGWLESDPQFDAQRTPIDQLHARSISDSVCITGQIWESQPDRSITVRDATGQITIPTEQPLTLPVGTFVDVVGHPFGRNLELTLRDPVVRLARRATSDLHDVKAAEPLLKLRLAEQVMELRPEEAAKRYPVLLRGVVTWSDPKASFFFLQDGSGGVRVQSGALPGAGPAIGMMIIADGVTTNGVFAPEVEIAQVANVEPAALPGARAVTLDEALTGSEEGQRIEMRGYLRDVERIGLWLKLNLTTPSGEFSAYVSPDPAVETNVGAMVRVTGVCAAITNEQRQLEGIRLWLTGAEAIQVEEARPADLFATPLRTIGSLRQFLAFHSVENRARVKGMVLYDRPGRYLYLQQGDAGMLVLHRDRGELHPGDWIEAVGLPGHDGSRLVLREASWRKTTPEANPAPLDLLHPSSLSPDFDGRLVRLQGKVQDTLSGQSGHRMMIRVEGALVEAQIDDVEISALPRPGSVVRAEGVYALEFDEYRRPRSFALLLRTPADLETIRSAPWWTPQRALAIAGAFALCALLGITWIVVLRRRVQEQTAQIRAQLENEARLHAELERAARLESLGILAGGIAHDFNNLLTVIMANLGLAAMDERVREAAGDIIADAERGARRASELTQQLLTFAKGGDPVRRAVVLADVVREAADFARHGSQVRCEYDFPSDLPPANVDRGQISRVIHNLVLNATQAMPNGGVIGIKLATVAVVAGEVAKLAPGTYIKLSVADNGPGIDPAHLSRIFEPYFSTKPKNNGLGLATVHSIVAKHQGSIQVRSEIGRGTTFDIWLPAASAAPSPAEPTPSARTATVAAKVLFMDDEEIIRRAAAGILRQLGHEAKLVADGADVIEEYTAALRAGRKYDVVVLDLTVPGGVGGRAAMEVLRRLDPDVRAIVSSGYSNDPVLANYAAYGFSAVVPKPYEVGQLSRAIQDVVARPPAKGDAAAGPR